MARRTYLDVLRGVAVLVMIEAHVIDAWTREADRHSRAFGKSLILGGFGAPLFLFLAGVMCAAIFSGYFAWPRGVQESLMILMAVLSWTTQLDRQFHVGLPDGLAGGRAGTISAAGAARYRVGRGFAVVSPGVPEPSTWLMMLAGFAGLGFAGYRASRKSVALA